MVKFSVRATSLIRLLLTVGLEGGRINEISLYYDESTYHKPHTKKTNLTIQE